ncbi:homeobox protein Hox-C10 isoform X2 [Macaca mulatta]
MTCPRNVTPNSYAEPLAAPGGGERYSRSAGMYMQSGSDFNCGVMRGCGLAPSLSKRDEGGSPSLTLNTYPSYLSQLDSWGDPKAAYRLEQPVGRPLSSCSYPPSVKEENVCCMYSAEKRAKSGPEAALYSHPLPESCLGEHEVPVPSYYRASPSYSALDKTPHCSGANDFEAPFEQRASLNPRAEHLESPQLGGKVSFPETPKSDNQTPSPSEIKTEQSLAGPKGSPSESEKERAKTADCSPDTSDNEAKGKAAWAAGATGTFRHLVFAAGGGGQGRGLGPGGPRPFRECDPGLRLVSAELQADGASLSWGRGDKGRKHHRKLADSKERKEEEVPLY